MKSYNSFTGFFGWLLSSEVKIQVCCLEQGYRYLGYNYMWYDGPFYCFGFWFFHIYFCDHFQ